MNYIDTMIAGESWSSHIVEDSAQRRKRALLCSGAGIVSSIQSQGGGVFDPLDSILAHYFTFLLY